MDETQSLLAPVHGEWGRASYLAPDLVRIKLKNPMGGLILNTYVHRARSGHVTAIDAGWPWTLDALDEALIEVGLCAQGLRGIDQWLYTHTHLDHMGAAALIEQRAEYAIHRAWQPVSAHLGTWHAFQDRANDWDPWRAEALAGEARARPPRVYGTPRRARAARAQHGRHVRSRHAHAL